MEQTYQKKTGGGGPIKKTPFKDLILYILGDGSDVVSGIEGMFQLLNTENFAKYV